MAVNQMYYEIVNNEDGTTTLYYGANEWVGATLKEVGSSDKLFNVGNSVSKISPKDDSIVELENYNGTIIYKYNDNTSSASGLNFDLTHILIKTGSFRLIHNNEGYEYLNYITIKELGLPSGIELAYRPWTVDCCVENRIFSRDYPDNYIPDMLNVKENYTMKQSRSNGSPILFNFGSGIDSVSIGYFPTMVMGNSENSYPGHLLSCSCSKVEFRTDVYWPVNSGFLCYYVSKEDNIDLSKIHINGNATNHPVNNSYNWGTPKNLITSNALQVERLYMPNCQGLNFVRRSDLNTYSIINDKCLNAELGGLEDTTNIECLFNGCSFLESVKLGGINNLLNAHRAFYNCTSLKKIEASIKLNELASGSEIFYNCSKLVGGNGTLFNSSNTGIEMLKVDREGTPGYLTYNKSTDYYGIYLPLSIRKSISVNYPYTQFSKGANVNVLFAGFSKDITLDYWLQYDPINKIYKNIGDRNPLTFEILGDAYLIPVLKKGVSASTYSVNLSSVPSNSCTLTGAGVYVAGDNVIITASPNEGYIFKQWEELINDTWVVLSDTKIFAINAIGRDRTIRAVCIKDTPDVAVSLTLLDDGNGTTFGSGRYLKGGKAEAAASAYAGYKFVKWTDELGNTVSASKVYTFIINKDTTLTANFAKDPYYNGGSSGTGGGGGNYDNESDIMGGANDKVSNFFGDTGGFISVYVMDNKLEDFRNLLFGTSLEGIAKNVLTNLGSLGGKFTDYILNFFKLPIHINSMVDKPFRMGWYATDDRYPYTYATGATKNFGTIHITPYWGNALDYKSKIQIYLPYIGYEYLDTAEIMGKDISLSYNISYLDGSCVAQIYVDNNLKYQFNGNCAMQIPISEVNMAEVTQKALSLGASVITAGASAGAAASSLTAGNAMSNFDMPSTQKLASSELSKGNQMANKVGDSLQNAMFNVGGDVRRCSNLSGNLGMMSSQTPYIIISRPRLSMPDNYAHYHGYPSNITSKIGDLSGYTVVSSIHLEGLDATSSEIEELEGILKSGFIVK